MYIKNIGEIKAVAFDIDGTLYKEGPLYFKMFPYVVRHAFFFMKYGVVRKMLHRDAGVHQFMRAQALLMAKYTRYTAEESRQRIERIVYNGLKDYFAEAKPCEHAYDVVKRLKESGLKIALLSDFPPEQKGDIWGIKPFCDVIMGTEVTGALKPCPLAFRKMAENLDVLPEQILYVGNNYKYDVLGSKNVGMKAAWFTEKRKTRLKNNQADIVFNSYYEFEKILFNEN